MRPWQKWAYWNSSPWYGLSRWSSSMAARIRFQTAMPSRSRRRPGRQLRASRLAAWRLRAQHPRRSASPADWRRGRFRGWGPLFQFPDTSLIRDMPGAARSSSLGLRTRGQRLDEFEKPLAHGSVLDLVVGPHQLQCFALGKGFGPTSTASLAVPFDCPGERAATSSLISSKKNPTGTSSTRARSNSRLAKMRLAPRSYFCTC